MSFSRALTKWGVNTLQVRPSQYPLGSRPFQPNGFSRIFVFGIFTVVCRNILILSTLDWDLCVFRWSVLVTETVFSVTNGGLSNDWRSKYFDLYETSTGSATGIRNTIFCLLRQNTRGKIYRSSRDTRSKAKSEKPEKQLTIETYLPMRWTKKCWLYLDCIVSKSE